MAVNDQRVQEIINQALAGAGGSGCDRAGQAWRNLKAWRDQPPAPGQPPNSLDLEVAAAENYMFARWSVCTGFVHPTQMKALAVAYYLRKRVGVDMRTSGNPMSEPDMGVARWGMRGADDGLTDRQQYNPGADPPYWRPVDEIMGRGTAGYVGRAGTAPSAPFVRYAPR